MNYTILIINIFFTSIGQLFLKKSSLITIDKNLIEKILNPFFLVGLFFYALSVLLWMKILEKLDISVAYPLMAISYIFVIIGANIFFQEIITVSKIIGVFFIIIGVFFITK